MITYFRDAHVLPLSDMKRRVIRYISQLPQMIAMIGNAPYIFRFEFPCDRLDAITWLNNQKNKNKIYWGNRDASFEMGGIAQADSITGKGDLNYKKIFEYFEDRIFKDNPHLRYYGGIGFGPNISAAEWQEFGDYQFIVPKFEIFNTKDSSSFSLNIKIEDISDDKIKNLIHEIEQINFAPETNYIKPPPKVESRLDIPDKNKWEEMFSRIFKKDGKFIFEKIVLARKSVFRFNRVINPIALMKHLKDMTPDCYHFCFQLSEANAFLGASPEQLYRKNGNQIESEAMAGTNPRGKTDQEDAQLERELLTSLKNSREHKFVVDSVLDHLKNLCTKLEVEKSFNLLKLTNWQHLVTRFNGRLDQKISHEKIIEGLHPTAAVCGTPRDKVFDAISKLEPFSRGWYAGPVGYVGHDASEFAVAIRSGLISQNKLSLYAGAGIVEGSTAYKEWDEIETKISNFLSVFEYEPHYSAKS